MSTRIQLKWVMRHGSEASGVLNRCWTYRVSLELYCSVALYLTTSTYWQESHLHSAVPSLYSSMILCAALYPTKYAVGCVWLLVVKGQTLKSATLNPFTPSTL